MEMKHRVKSPQFIEIKLNKKKNDKTILFGPKKNS